MEEAHGGHQADALAAFADGLEGDPQFGDGTDDAHGRKLASLALKGVLDGPVNGGRPFAEHVPGIFWKDI